MRDENIISFREKTKDIKSRTISEKSNVFNICSHTSLIVDDHLKVIECERCGYVQNPWEYIMKLAKQEDRIFSNLKYAKKEYKTIKNQSDDLKKAVKNLKSTLKRTLEKISLKNIELNKE